MATKKPSGWTVVLIYVYGLAIVVIGADLMGLSYHGVLEYVRSSSVATAGEWRPKALDSIRRSTTEVDTPAKRRVEAESSSGPALDGLTKGDREELNNFFDTLE